MNYWIVFSSFNFYVIPLNWQAPLGSWEVLYLLWSIPSRNCFCNYFVTSIFFFPKWNCSPSKVPGDSGRLVNRNSTTTMYAWGKRCSVCFMAFFISSTFHMPASRDSKSLVFRKKMPIKILNGLRSLSSCFKALGEWFNVN